MVSTVTSYVGAKPPKQVVTIHKDGSMSGLERKGRQGIDLKTFGQASVKRASHIVWDEDKQLWFVCLGQDGELPLTEYMFYSGCKKTDFSIVVNGYTPEEIIYFENYDDAVMAEIQYLDYLRKFIAPLINSYMERKQIA